MLMYSKACESLVIQNISLLSYHFQVVVTQRPWILHEALLPGLKLVTD